MKSKKNIDCEDCYEPLNCNHCCTLCLKDNQDIVFSKLTEENLESLADDKQIIKFNPGETILKQNTSSTHVICIREGFAKVFIEGMNGKKLILKIIGKHGFITAGGIFADHVRHFTVSAVGEVECCFINSDKIINFFSSNNEFAIELMKFHNNLNNELLNTLVNLTQKYMHGRVADSLLYLKNEVFKNNPFNMPLSRQELADMSAMAKESYIRILKEFKNSGIVHPNGNSIKILDEEALINISKNG